MEARFKTASTIFCFRFDISGWHENPYDLTLADAVCGRIICDSYIIRVEVGSGKKHKGTIGEPKRQRS